MARTPLEPIARLVGRLSPRAVLWGAVALNVLVFLRVAVMYAPFYSYEGPSGADRVYYYAYARSVVIDGDLNFANEFAIRPPTTGEISVDGRPLNKYPIGTPLLSLPAFAATHAVLVLLHGLGLPVRTDGYSAPDALAYALSQMAFALLGIWLLYLTLRAYFSDEVAIWAVMAAWLGTNAFHYTAVDLMMSHAAALFSTAWCGYEAVTLARSGPSTSKGFRLGVSAGLVVLVRFQNAVFLLVPAAALLSVLLTGRPTTTMRKWLPTLASVAGGGLTIFIPQLLVWKALFGSWAVNSYGREFAFNWRHPHLFEVLVGSPSAGLLIWVPILAIGITGCLSLAARRRDIVAGAAGVAWLIHVYVISAWWAWDLLASRATFDLLLPIALGLGWVLASSSMRRYGTLVASGLAILVVWNLPFAALGVPLSLHPSMLLAAWAECVRTLL